MAFQPKAFFNKFIKTNLWELNFSRLEFSELIFITNFFILCNADGFWSSSDQTYFNQLEIIFTL